ncbi:hypothetical protein FS815_25530 [Agrobacterium vitis]|nr:hypothetical protein [Allorhizobium ampelinum]
MSTMNDNVYHVASLAKCLSPALRVTYVAVPEGRSLRFANAIRASASIVSPLTSAVAVRWIENGPAGAARDEITEEGEARLKVANDALQARGDVNWRFTRVAARAGTMDTRRVGA